MTETKPLPLTVAGVTAGYNDLDIIYDIDIEVREQEIVTIIGPNGAGKSTLLKTIFGLLSPRHGSIRLRGQELAGLAPDKLVQAGMGYVPQIDNVFPSLTVRENLEMGAFTIEKAAAVESNVAKVYELFPILAERAAQRVGKMSGGQRQMVAMGRALMSDPTILLLDEPSAGLAPNTADEAFRNIRTIAQSGVPILLVEQNAKKALRLCDRAYVLDMGRNKFEGPGQQLLDDPQIGRLYLGG